MPEVVMSGLRHITSVFNAISIAEGGIFRASDSGQAYDAGMNLLGVLGESSNTWPRARGAELVCSWHGKVSPPLCWDRFVNHEANVMLDFNGSGNVYQNNDPRYLLPIGSQGLQIDRIVIHDLKEYVDVCVVKASAAHPFLYRRGWVRTTALDDAIGRLANLSLKCERGEITLRIEGVASASGLATGKPP